MTEIRGYDQWRPRIFHLGLQPRRSGRREVPQWDPGANRGLGDFSGTKSPESEAVCRHCLQNLTAKAIKI